MLKKVIIDAIKAIEAADDMSENYNDRKIGSTEIGNIRVSTVFTTDMGYETAICMDKVHPVQRYKTKKLAEKGHESWCNKIRNKKINKITRLGYLSLEKDSIVEIKY